MIEKVAWIEAIIQRPAMRWRSSSSASRRLSWLKLSVSSSLLPIVLPSSTPETESDSSTSDEMSASDPCLVDAISRRTRPILRVIRTKMGSSAKAASASRQSRHDQRDGRGEHGRHVRRDRGRGRGDDGVDAADVVGDAALHLAGARAREERERQALQVAVDGRRAGRA